MEQAKPTRYTIDLAPDARETLATLARQYKLTQGEVIEVLLAQVTIQNWGEVVPITPVQNALTARREQKVAMRKIVRQQRHQLLSKLAKLTPEQLAKLEQPA